MGPYVPPRVRSWGEAERISQAERPRVRYTAEVADRMRDRWRSGLCPCGCGMDLATMRQRNPDLYNTYRSTGVWTGPLNTYA